MDTNEHIDHEQFAGTKVLVVDDDRDVLRILRAFLEQRGYVFVGASNSEQALTKTKDENPQVVLLDIQLPDRNGLEVLQEIHGIDRNIRIIVISGWAVDVLSDEALHLGAFDFVTKPFDLDILERLLFQCLKSKSLDEWTDTEKR